MGCALALAGLLAGCGDDRVRLADADIERIADRAAQKVMDRLLDKGSDDLAARLYRKTQDLDRVHARSDRAVPRSPEASMAAPVAALRPAPGPAVAIAQAGGGGAAAGDPGGLARAGAEGAGEPFGLARLPGVSPASIAAVAAVPAGPAAPDPGVLRGGERTWSASQIAALASSRGVSLDAKNAAEFLEEMVGYELAAIRARGTNVARLPAHEQRLRNARAEFAAHALYRDRMARMGPVTEAEVRARYERSLATLTERERADVEEYVVQGADAADLRKLKLVLVPGADFGKLSAAGKVPGTVRALGRTVARPGHYPVEVFRQLRSLAPGEMTDPARSPEGDWKAVRLVAYHPEKAPALASVRESLRRAIEADRVQEALNQVDADARSRVVVKTHYDRISDPASQTVLAEIDGVRIQRQDVLHEMASLPDAYRARFQTPSGFRELVERVVQKMLFARWAYHHAPGFARVHAEALEEIEKQELVRTYLEEVMGPRIDLSASEVERYWRENPHERKLEHDQVRLRLISFAATRADLKATAVQKAGRALERLKKGDSFATVAREMTEDANLRSRGGETGWVGLDQLPAPLRTEVERMTPGRHSPAPVTTADGFHLVLLEERRGELPLEDARARFEPRLRAEKQRTVFRDLVADWRKSTPVEAWVDRLLASPSGTDRQHSPPGAARTAGPPGPPGVR
jgi:parvulin-like peptidyl-prolyl isomerase